MERATAFKKLTKLLGKNFRYQFDPKAPNKETRDAARVELKAASEERKILLEKLQARQNVLLEADEEYQSLRVRTKTARERVQHLSGIANHYKITVGDVNDIYFHVKAEGDSWEEVIAKLREKQP